jgi:hypothetical protein
MAFWAKLFIPVIILGLVGVADAKGKKGKGGLTGKIVSVSGNKIVIQSKGKKSAGTQPITIQTDMTTTVEIDGVPGKKVSELHAGERVIITGDPSAVVSDIKATSGKSKGKKKKSK